MVGLQFDFNCDVLGDCKSYQDVRPENQNPPPPPPPPGIRYLPQCEKWVYLTGFDGYPGMNGWYQSKQPGAPWAVFEHELYNQGIDYQIAPDHTRGMDDRKELV